MRNKIQSLILFIFCLGFTVNTGNVFAQSETKDFGWSLKKFESNRKQEKKDKKQKNTSQNKEQPDLQASTPVSIQTLDVENNKTASDDETIRVETNLVVDDILVVDEKGTAVPNLKPEDFIINEDGVEQKIELFAYGENAKLPRLIVLIMSSHFLPYQDAENGLSGAEWLIDKLAPQDKMAIVTSDLKLWSPFTKDKKTLKKTLTNIPPTFSGLTIPRCYGTLIAVLEEMFDEKDVRPIIIFQSGGSELFNLKPDADTIPVSESARKNYLKFGDGERGYGLSDVKESVIKSRAVIYSVIPAMRFVGLPKEEQSRRAKISIEEWMWFSQGEKNSNRVRDAVKKYQSEEIVSFVSAQSAMIDVAKLSGGYTEFIERPEDVAKVYSTIFAVINNRYTIGYYSTNEARDGKLRRVKIAVRNRPQYMVLGRESYFAPKQ